MKNRLINGSLLLLVSTNALAHPEHGLQNAYAGFVHPFTGWDHLLMMLAIGVWAAKLSGHMRWLLPVTFIGVMVIGASLGFLGISFTGIEAAIAVSVIAMGGLLVMKMPMSAIASVSAVAVFASLHGLAHGLELSNTHHNNALLGMLLATAVLHGIGYMVALQRHQFQHWVNAGLAFFMMIVGSLLLVY